MESNIRKYTDDELLSRMKSLPSFTHFPKGHHFIFVRAENQVKDMYNCKGFLFFNKRFIAVFSCTTISGNYGLKNFLRWNKLGAAVIKFDEIYYNSFIKSDGKYVKHHNGKLQCFRQIAPLKYFRDGNMDDVVNDSGKVYSGNYNTNIHSNSYNYFKGIRSWWIGKWGTGCTVINDLTKYFQVLMKRINYNEPITYTGLKEF